MSSKVSVNTGATLFCESAADGNMLQISCPLTGMNISGISFASYGNPDGNCNTTPSKGDCDASNTLSIVEKVYFILYYIYIFLFIFTYNSTKRLYMVNEQINQTKLNSTLT